MPAVHRAASLPASLRQRSLMRLTQMLQQQPDALFPPAESSSAAAAGLQPASHQVVEAIWQLVRLSSELQDVQMAALAGERLRLMSFGHERMQSQCAPRPLPLQAALMHIALQIWRE